jgi:hypothetical protein
VVHEPADVLLGGRRPILAKAGGNSIATLATDPMNPRLLGFPVVIAQKLPVVTPGSGKAMFSSATCRRPRPSASAAA